MIQKLVLENFQIHKKLELDFDPGVTVIVGPSNRGKSSILRALNWITFNKPSGTMFRTWESNRTSASLLLDDGTIIERGRSDKENSYIINGNLLAAFGQGVPDQVQKTLNLLPINFQHQMDNPFLVMDSPGEVARKLNEVANLELIDTATAKISKYHREASKSLSNEKDNLRQLRKDLKEFNWIDAAEELIQSGLVLEKDLEQLEIDYNELSTSIKRVEFLDVELGDFQAQEEVWIDVISKLEAVQNLDKERLELDEKIKSLSKVLSDFESLEAKEQEAIDMEKETAKLLLEIMPEICPLCDQPTKGAHSCSS